MILYTTHLDQRCKTTWLRLSLFWAAIFIPFHRPEPSSVNPLHVYWSRQPRVTRRLTLLLFKGHHIWPDIHLKVKSCDYANHAMAPSKTSGIPTDDKLSPWQLSVSAIAQRLHLPNSCSLFSLSDLKLQISLLYREICDSMLDTERRSSAANDRNLLASSFAFIKVNNTNDARVTSHTSISASQITKKWAVFKLLQIDNNNNKTPINPEPRITGLVWGNHRQLVVPSTRASYQIRKVTGCTSAGNGGDVFPATDFEGNR